VLKTRVEETPTGAPPGTVVDVSRDAIHVATGHGGRLAIGQLQLEGGRPMAVRDFLAGHRVRSGVAFTN
jgi:methionyl-tRNA formyltransferase